MKHGHILGGVVTTPDLDAALADYRDTLGLQAIEQAPLDAALAAAWDAPALAGVPAATLQPASGAPCFVRLVEQPLPPAFKPTTTFGWAAFEMTVQDVHGWPARLAVSGFEIVGPPKAIAGMPAFVPMQVTGRGGELVYLNEVHGDMPTADLPRAASPVDRIFIVVLAAYDRTASLAWYRDKVGLDEGGTYTLEYTMINRAFGLPAGTRSTITMAQAGRTPVVEIDSYPDAATARTITPGHLPPANALVTLAVDRLPALDWIAVPHRHLGLIYAGRRAATARGPAGELVEFVELS